MNTPPLLFYLSFFLFCSCSSSCSSFFLSLLLFLLFFLLLLCVCVCCYVSLFFINGWFAFESIRGMWWCGPGNKEETEGRDDFKEKGKGGLHAWAYLQITEACYCRGGQCRDGTARNNAHKQAEPRWRSLGSDYLPVPFITLLLRALLLIVNHQRYRILRSLEEVRLLRRTNHWDYRPSNH